MTERVLTPPLDPITAPVRSNLADIAKGIAILLVVYEHTGQGMSARGWWTGASRHFSYLFVYSFHMPVFFFVAGLFLAGSARRRGPLGFTMEKAKTILYLYLFWAILLGAIEPFISRFKNHPPPFHWQSFPLSLIDGGAGWFFPVLFLCQIVALGTIRMPTWLRFSLAAIAAMLMPSMGYEVFYKTVWFFCFVAGGMVVGRSIFRLSELRVWSAALIALLIFAFQAAIVHHFGESTGFGGPPAWQAVMLGFTGTIGLFFLARTIENTRMGDLWAWIGQASLGIFLMAQFSQGATREFLLRVGHTHEFWLQLLLPTILSTILPAILWHQQRWLRIGWLFRWPIN